MEKIEKRAKLYRVGRDTFDDGLWYDRHGNETGIIHTIPFAAAAALPMGPNPIFRSDGRQWISCTDTIAMLRVWFSVENLRWLLDHGYQVQEIEVERYRRVTFPMFEHEVFCREDVIAIASIDPSLVYAEVFDDARAAA